MSIGDGTSGLPPARREAEEWPVGLAGRPRSVSAVGLPMEIGLRAAMMLVSFALIDSHALPSGVPRVEGAVTLGFHPGLPGDAGEGRRCPSSPVLGNLMATPFAIVIASKIAQPPLTWTAGWLLVVLGALAVGNCLTASYCKYITIDRTTRFRQDFVRQGRKWDLAVPEPNTSVALAQRSRGYSIALSSIRGEPRRITRCLSRKVIAAIVLHP